MSAPSSMVVSIIMSSLGSSFTAFIFVLTFTTSAVLITARIVLWTSSSLILNFGPLRTTISSFRIKSEIKMDYWFVIPLFKSSLDFPSEIIALIRTLVKRTNSKH